MYDRKELYKSAEEKSEDDELCCVVARALDKLRRENPGLYNSTVEEMEDIAFSISKEDAERIVRNMSPRGQYWTFSQVAELCKTKGIEGKDKEFYLAMNMAYNDYYNTAALYGLQKDVEFFFSLAKDFIFDQDGKPHKVAKYFSE